jgi:hypothetical protein
VPAPIAVFGENASLRYTEFVAPTSVTILSVPPGSPHICPAAAHESPRTTKLFDRTKERLTQIR